LSHWHAIFADAPTAFSMRGKEDCGWHSMFVCKVDRAYRDYRPSF